MSEVQFVVRNRQRKKAAQERAGPVDVSMVVRAEKLRISEAKLSALVDHFGEDAVQAGLSAVERRVSKTDLRAVENTYSYLRSVLRSGDAVAGTTLTTPPDAMPEPADSALIPQGDLSDGSVPRGAGEKEALRRAERFAQVRDELKGLGPHVHRAYAEAVMNELSSSGRVSPVMRRRAAQGDYFFGPLGVLLVQRYAAEKYGPNWSEE